MLIKIFGAPYFRMLYGPPMSYGTDHCSKVSICSSKEVKRNRDAIVEAYGRKSDLAELHPNRLARPEGFEPPTLRSEERLRHRLTRTHVEKKSETQAINAVSDLRHG